MVQRHLFEGELTFASFSSLFFVGSKTSFLVGNSLTRGFCNVVEGDVYEGNGEPDLPQCQDYLSRYFADSPWKHIGVEYNFQIHHFFNCLHPDKATGGQLDVQVVCCGTPIFITENDG